jgi:hypothetical protein
MGEDDDEAKRQRQARHMHGADAREAEGLGLAGRTLFSSHIP